MPGMAEPDIAIDIVTSAPGVSGLQNLHPAEYAPRLGLATRTLSLISLDSAVTAGTAFACFALFNPVAKFSEAAVMVPMLCLVFCMILSFFERGLYTAPEVMCRDLPWRKIALAWVQAVAVATLGTFCVTALFPIASSTNAGAVSDSLTAILRGAWLPILLPLGFATLCGARYLWLRGFSGAIPLNRTVIVGETAQIQELLLRLRSGMRPFFDVVGVVDHAAESLATRSILGIPMLSDLDTLERMIRRDAVDTVLVAFPLSASEQMRTVISRVSMAPVDVHIYPGMKWLDLASRKSAAPSTLPLLTACTRPIDGWGATIKRTEDIVLSLTLLLFISPAMLTIAALIKLTSRGPVFFRQRRLGYNNRVIEILKFRSMYTHLSDADAKMQAFRGDKRVTSIGTWLRKTSLDEVPQLLNVLKGDMSLVGPRPHALATTAGGLALEEAVPVYSSRHRVKPGITGWAQINGYRGALDSVDKIVHRVNHDLYYIENWSLALDLKILWRTARLVFADDNAF